VNAVLQCERVKVLFIHAMTSLRGTGGIASLSASALNGGKWSASRSGRFTPEKRDPITRWMRDWVVSRAGMDVVFKDDFSLKVMAYLNKHFCFC
jgi:hypothetical protein